MINFKNIQYQYEKLAMNFNFNLAKGELVFVIGTSGAGKTTLLNLLAGFIEAKSGEIWLNNQNFTNKPPSVRPVSMLFQDNNLFMHLNVYKNLALGLSPNLKLDENQKHQLKKIAQKIGLLDYLTAFPNQLSGGQKKRVAIGRCLLQKRPILVLDEPFSSLDPKLKKEMFNLLKEIKSEFDLTVLMVTHQLEDISPMQDRCLMIDEGKIVFDGYFNALMQNEILATKLGA